MGLCKGLISIFFVCTLSMLNAQQEPTWSSFYENGFIWNPALTARWNTWELSSTFRKDWIGFDGAPESGNIGFQYPFIRRFTKVAAGGFVDYDKVGGYSRYGMTGTYAYKIKPRLFGNRNDVLTFGGKLSFHQYRFNPEELNPFDGSEVDFSLVPNQTSYIPDLGTGIYYVNVTDQYSYKSHYYFGAAFNRLIPARINTGPLGSYQNRVHASLHGGYRYFPFKAPYYIEPSVFVNYAFAKAVNVMASCRYEMVDKFWIAAGAVTNGELFGQFGFIFDRESVIGKVVKDGILRVGTKVDYQVGSFRRYAGVGYEAYVAYLFSNEPY